jgi:hypothetical protein
MSFTSTHKPSPTTHFTDHNQPTLGSNPVCQCGTSIGRIVRLGRVDLWLSCFPFLLFIPHYRKLGQCTLVLMIPKQKLTLTTLIDEITYVRVVPRINVGQGISMAVCEIHGA